MEYIQEIFQNKFLFKQYYEERAKEFYELKLGTMNMKELNSKFLSLLRYVPYIVDKKPKVQWFLSYLPYHIKDMIEYENPKTLEEAMRKANLYMNRIVKRRVWPTRRPKEIITLNKKRKVSYLTEILRIVIPEIFLVKISKGTKVTHRPIQTIKGIKNLLTTTVTIQSILNERNP